jgi:hypothetical protein
MVGGSVTIPIISDLDLEISQNIQISERFTTVNYPTKTIEITESPSALFVIVNLQNFGDELKRLFITIKCQENIYEQLFSSFENILDMKYDFQQFTEITMPLMGNRPLKSTVTFQMNITLEYYQSVNDITANFNVLGVKIRQIGQMGDSDILLFPDTFNIRYPGTTRVNQNLRVFMTSYIVTKLVPSSQMELKVNLETNFPIEYYELEGVAMNQLGDETDDISQFSLILIENYTKIGIRIKPEMQNSPIDFFVKINPISLENHSKDNNDIFEPLDIPNHPIPAEVMFVLLNLIIFGVPLIVIFKEDTKIGKKIKNIMER